MRKKEGLRILIVTPALPYPPVWGFGIRVYQFLRHLSQRHRVTLLTYAYPNEDDHVAALRRDGYAIHAVRPPIADVQVKRRMQVASVLSPLSYQRRSLQGREMQSEIDRVLAGQEFDLIQVESSQMAGFDLGGRAPVVLDEHNIEYELLHRMCRGERSPVRRLYNWSEFLKFRREERRSWSRADACVLTSPREEQILRAHVPGKPAVTVPNGVDVGYFHIEEGATDPGSIVFTGLIKYRPNSDAAVYFAREILPRVLRQRPDAKFTVVGISPPEEVRRLAGPNVVITGGVPDVRPYVQRAAIFAVPLRMGSGTRLKVLEGLAMGKAMVSTSLGCEGVGVRDGEHLLVADEPEAFARAVLRLMEDASLAAALGQRGRALVESEYGWASVVRGLEAFYAEVLAVHRSTG